MAPAYRTDTRAKRRDDSRSLVFLAGDEPVLALTSGANRVDVERLAAVKGAPRAGRARRRPRAATGFAIGGTPPLGHERRLRVFLDRDLLAFEEVWAAASTPDAVFRAGPQALAAAAGAEIADFADRLERGWSTDRVDRSFQTRTSGRSPAALTVGTASGA
jgi:prolyl-tRNA editing enzyme YbaK/EbsC (Cys-tRNA(Pro) deacylase)